MAAKVAVVAIPTVLGIASIRVYTVKEKPTEDLLPRERLNIYTPLSQCAQAQIVRERSGIIHSGITSAREGIQPFVQASKNAYSSVKTGTSKLYHTLEDVFYYLKDPPPEFLPRFGTITMAGLLGMFLARKGSRFKRTLVPLGLMSAAASVCYPAQAVAVVKVTGKKAYAAGQWSSAVVSSIFASKPQQSVTKDPASPQPQGDELPIVESAVSQEASEGLSTKHNSVQSPTVPQTEAALPESVRVSDQTVIAITPEKVSSVTVAELPPGQIPAGTGASSEEPSDTEQVSSHAHMSTPTLEPKTVEAAQVEAAQAEDTPAEVTSVDSEPSVPVVKVDPPHEATATTPQHPAAEHNRDGSVFKPDPALMDFGQSSPEDEDLYSTRS